MSQSVTMLGLLAVGWGLLWFALTQDLAPTFLTLVLGTIVFAECLSAVIVSPIKLQGRTSNQDDLAKVLLSWVLTCVLLVPLFQFQFLPFYQGQPSLVLSLLALTLVLALLKFAAQGHALAQVLKSLRLLLAAAGLLTVNWIGGTGVDLLLSSILLSHLVVLLGIFACTRKSTEKVREPVRNLPFDTFGRYVDLLILPMVLGASDALPYLLGRCLTIAVTAGLSQLGSQAMPALIAGRQHGEKLEFIRMAARLNLGFLLVGGGIALAVITVGPYLTNAIGVTDSRFQSVLLWLVLGTSAPILFGATDTLFDATGKQNNILCLNVAAGGHLACAILFAPNPSALFIAQCFACIQLAKSGLAAVILVRYAGVWPGLTAILLRQIKLL